MLISHAPWISVVIVAAMTPLLVTLEKGYPRIHPFKVVDRDEEKSSRDSFAPRVQQPDGVL